MILSKRELSTALRRLAKAQTAAFEQRALIAQHCKELYGVDPAEVDNDEFIDSCDGGCGTALGMTADRFHASMLESMERHGVDIPQELAP